MACWDELLAMLGETLHRISDTRDPSLALTPGVAAIAAAVAKGLAEAEKEGWVRATSAAMTASRVLKAPLPEGRGFFTLQGRC
ncbi:hypothetical protein, partial [Streptomyces chiangmaiensis]